MKCYFGIMKTKEELQGRRKRFLKLKEMKWKDDNGNPTLEEWWNYNQYIAE